MGFKAVHYSEIKQEEIAEEGVAGTEVRWLITLADGAKHFAMRLFEMMPGGHSPLHSHSWEHEVFVVDGECSIICGGQSEKARSGYVIFIPPETTHQFRNDGNRILKFLCLVPHHE